MMTIEESIKQLEDLIEDWDLDETELNQTDVNAIKKVLEERRYIIKYLKHRINECNNFIRHIEHKMKNVSGLGRIAEKAYLTNQIMTSSVAEKCYEEILNKIEKR